VSEITTVGIDLAKSVFQLHGVSNRGRVLLRKQVRRAQLLRVVSQLPRCVIGMEACASSQHWRRQFEHFGHTVRLMSPQYVKAYVKSQKNDRADAEAICEAVQRPNMRFVPPKSLEQQDLQSAHRVRQGLMTERTAVINRLRGLLNEYGEVLARRPATVRREVPQLLGDARNGLTAVARELIADLYEHFLLVEQRIVRTEALIERLGTGHELVERLQTIPGIGMLTATALVAAVGDAKSFKNGRHMAAWVGLVPRQDSSGGKARLLGITKRGDKYLRCLLVHGARSITTHAQRRPTAARAWINALCERRGKHRAYVAQANKTARIAWAVMTSGHSYRAAAAATKSATMH
jgi:transposase